MLSDSAAVLRSQRLFVVLGSGLSAALGGAGVGVALFAPGPVWPAVALAGLGAVAGAVLAQLCYRVDASTAARPDPLSSSELASLVRVTLAQVQQERAAARRGGSAADRRPQPDAAPAEPGTPARQPEATPALAGSVPARRRRADHPVEA